MNQLILSAKFNRFIIEMSGLFYTKAFPQKTKLTGIEKEEGGFNNFYL